MNSSRTRRLTTVGALTGSALLLAAVPAFAHVSVTPSSAAKGGYSTVAFKVPNERDNASTIKLEVNLPADHPIASVSTQAVPGWKVEVVKSKLAKPITMHGKQVTEAVTKITWSGGTIEPGQFQQFPVSFGPLPDDTDQLVFKALQTYSNNEVVRWIEEEKPGAAEPANPAPALKLTAATTDAHGSAAPAADTKAQASTTAAADSDDSDTTARILGVAGIVVGVIGVAFGVLAGRRRTSV
ncbi:YcnI family protein [Streptomyces sp. NPDC006733]|uniref:YcnI family copper-binding membrane protein n=1 Tax=Streptomyces sp. NPDC006733 TaxID=3155460 RepID=UPI0033D8D947